MNEEIASVADDAPEDTGGEPRTRRHLLAAGAVGAAAAVVAGAIRPGEAEAAAGSALIIGRSNTSGTAGTYLTSASSAPTMKVHNSGAGAAALYTAANSNGFAGGTYAAGRYGLSAANFAGSFGGGAGMAASGINNYGVLANTQNPDAAALLAEHLYDQPHDGSAVIGSGHGVGVTGVTDNPDQPGVVGGNISELAPAAGVIGLGVSGVLGYSPVTDGIGVVALGDAAAGSTALYAEGQTWIEGDLYVNGTIYAANTTIQPLPTAATTSSKITRLKRSAAKTAERLRTKSTG